MEAGSQEVHTMNRIAMQAGRGLPAAVAAVMWLTGPAAAQGVTYVTVSKVEMAGAMGMVARMAPGALDETRVTTFMQGLFLRSDEGTATSTIMDLAEGRYTFLDHEERTYHTLTLAEMMGQAQGAMGGVAGGGSESGSPELKVERTGRTQRFDGFTAEQVLLLMEPAEGQGAGPGAESAVATAFLTEVWISRDFPGHEAFRRAQEAAATGTMGAGGGFAVDPAMMEASMRVAEEMKGLDGVPVRTVTSFVMVPPGAAFDKDAVLAAADQPLESPSLAGMAAGGARDAARQALGGVMGRRRQQEQPQEAAGPATQSITMRVTQTVQDVRVGDVPAERFQVPAGYREAPPGIG